jgi:hypothetical protein
MQIPHVIVKHNNVDQCDFTFHGNEYVAQLPVISLDVSSSSFQFGVHGTSPSFSCCADRVYFGTLQIRI